MLALTPPRPASPRSAAAIDVDLSALDQSPAGCGWFDSSWELRRGLAISELQASDLAVAALWFPALASALPDAGLSVHWQ